MKFMSLLSRTVMPVLVALPTFAFADFEEASHRIDLDGSFVAYLDFDGDGLEFGTKLNQVYQQALAANPQMPPIPIDFPAIFDTLGFGSVRAMAMSSKELDGGLKRNRSVTFLDGEPTGLMGLYGIEPRAFEAAQLAPADADTAISGQLRITAIRDTLHALATQLLGPMGDGMAQKYLNTPLPNTELTGNQIVEALSGRIDFVMHQSFTPDGQPKIELWARIAGAGSLLAELQPLAEGMPIEFTETTEGLEADLSALLEDAPMGLIVRASNETGALEMFTSRKWEASIGGPGERLVDQPEFQRVTAGLPPTAGFYSYSAGFDTAQLDTILGQQPEVAPYLPLIKDAVTLLAGDFIGPNASAVYRDGEVLIGEQYAGYSYKQMILAVPASIGGLTAAMAIPAFQKVRQTSQEKAVENNLRQYASAAQQYMLDEGVNEVTYGDIVGPDKYILQLESVAGESYEDIVVTDDTWDISVTLPDGRVITYSF